MSQRAGGGSGAAPGTYPEGRPAPMVVGSINDRWRKPHRPAPFITYSLAGRTRPPVIHLAYRRSETACGKTIPATWPVFEFRDVPAEQRCRVCCRVSYTTVFLPVPTTSPQSSGWIDWISNGYEAEAFPPGRPSVERLLLH